MGLFRIFKKIQRKDQGNVLKFFAMRFFLQNHYYYGF